MNYLDSLRREIRKVATSVSVNYGPGQHNAIFGDPSGGSTSSGGGSTSTGGSASGGDTTPKKGMGWKMGLGMAAMSLAPMITQLIKGPQKTQNVPQPKRTSMYSSAGRARAGLNMQQQRPTGAYLPRA